MESLLSQSMTVGLLLTATNPFELVRLRLQTSTELVKCGSIVESHSSITQTLKNLYNQHGLKGLWRGNALGLARLLPAQTMNFSFKNGFQSVISQSSGNTAIVNMLAGVLGAWTTQTLLYPLDSIRNRICTTGLSTSLSQTPQLNNKIQAITAMTGVYRGFCLSLVGSALFRGSYFCLFDSLKSSQQSEAGRWGLSYCSMAVALGVSYPVDTIRRRIMVSANGSDQSLKALWTYGTQIVGQQGLKSFYKGLPIALVTALGSSAVYCCFDKATSKTQKSQ